MNDRSFALDTTYVQLTDDGRARAIEVGDGFWTRLATRTELHAGRLLCAFDVPPGDGDHSEMHPAGDEILIAVAGAIEIVFERDRDGREPVVVIRSGDACVVPRGTWHRLRSPRGGRMISLTPGAGTEHRAASR